MKRIILFAALFVAVTIAIAQDLTKLYDKTKPSVVLLITEEKEVINSGIGKQQVTMEGLGSGVLINEREIVTASHVVHLAENIQVVFSDGQKIPATVESSWPEADVALVRLSWKPDNPVIAKMADSDQVRVGQQVFVIGAPYGLEYSLSSGYISGKIEKGNMSNSLKQHEYFQTDAAINQGNSGGPMFNMDGEVIGIVSYILSNSGGFEGLGFAVTSNVVDDLLFNRTKFWSGINWVFLGGPMAEIFNLPQPGGLLVQRVVPLSPVGMMGVKGGVYSANIEGQDLMLGGDIILEVNAIPVISEENFQKILDSFNAMEEGDTFTLKILRAGRTQMLEGQVPAN
jgi:serine protease Do